MQHRNADGSWSSQAYSANHVFRLYIIVFTRAYRHQSPYLSLSTKQWPRLLYSSKREVHAILPIQCIRNQKLRKRECETVSVATHVRFPNRLQAPPTHYWRTNQPAEKILISQIEKSDLPISAGGGLLRGGKIKVHPRTVHEGPDGIFCNLGAWCGWVVNATPRPPYPRARNRYPLYRTLGKPQGRSGQARNIPSPPGLDPHTQRSVPSWNTNYAIRPNCWGGEHNTTYFPHGMN